MVLADAHSHLLEPWFSPEKIENVVKDAKANQVSIIINVGPTEKQYQATLDSAEKFDEIYANIGLQPTHVNENSFEIFKNFVLANKKQITAIGEVGLDYYWIKDSKHQANQRNFFTRIIHFANELTLPLVIHSRASEKDALELLNKFSNVPVLLHCFEGKMEEIRLALDFNYRISVPTSVKNRKKFRKVALQVPLDNMTLETDAPFQSPFNGTKTEKPPKNEPKNIVLSCQKISELHEVSFDTVAQTTTRNTKKFFNI